MNVEGREGRRDARAFLFVALGAACWGTDALFRRGLALELPAPTVVFYEHLILVALTLPLLRGAGARVRALTRADWLALLLIGAGASAMATWLFTLAMRQGDPTTPLLLQKLQPLFAVAGAHLLLGERLRPRFGSFALAALAFAWLVSFADPLHVSVRAGLAAGLALGAAALWAMGTVLGRHLSPALRTGELTALRFAIGLPASLLVLLVDGGTGYLAVGSADLPGLVALALVPGLLGMLLYYRGLRGTPASSATIGELAFPLVAVGVNWVAFGATLRPTQWLGLAGLAGTLLLMSRVTARDGPAAVGVLPPDEPAVPALAAAPEA